MIGIHPLHASIEEPALESAGGLDRTDVLGPAERRVGRRSKDCPHGNAAAGGLRSPALRAPRTRVHLGRPVGHVSQGVARAVIIGRLDPSPSGLFPDARSNGPSAKWYGCCRTSPSVRDHRFPSGGDGAAGHVAADRYLQVAVVPSLWSAVTSGPRDRQRSTSRDRRVGGRPLCTTARRDSLDDATLLDRGGGV